MGVVASSVLLGMTDYNDLGRLPRRIFGPRGVWDQQRQHQKNVSHAPIVLMTAFACQRTGRTF
jgi:hypothetical protein